MTPTPGSVDPVAPLTPVEFAQEMVRFGPFEPNPEVVAAVSGGADSMALALLLQDWLEKRGGRLHAVTVDHGLRPGAAAEALEAARRLKAQGVKHRILRWRGEKPRASLQAAARTARYDLLSAYCRDRGILHLFVAQHRDDQAETFLLRLARGSGLDGAAAMAPLRCTPDMRILRPLLAVPKARLEASLAARGLGWAEDPSNRNRSFARIRLRQLLPELAREGLTAERLSKTAHLLGRSRQALQVTLAGFLARHVRCDPSGYLLLEHAALLRAPEEIALRALASCLMSVGGRGFGPRLDRLEQLYGALGHTTFSGATLSRVRLSLKAGQLLFVREARGLDSCRLRPGESGRWDGRFDLCLGLRPGPGKGPIVVRALGREGRRELRRGGHRDLRPLPAAVQVTLPSLWDDLGLIFVPFLGYCRKGWEGAKANRVIFRPNRPLLAAFTLV